METKQKHTIRRNQPSGTNAEPVLNNNKQALTRDEACCYRKLINGGVYKFSLL